MPALPAGPDPIADQDHTHGWIRALLGAVTSAVLEEQPALGAFGDHRPERDRPSGSAWRGLETMCHVSALLASAHAPEPGSAQQLLDTAEGAAARRGLRRRSEREENGVRASTWRSDRGDLLEVIVGVRVAIRAVSAPFLPGSLRPASTTSPDSPFSPLSPLTLPPRLPR